jgi:hypothetical protein
MDGYKSEKQGKLHADGYRVDLETDPLRAAAYLLSNFIASHQLEDYNRPYTLRALSGDASGLLTGTIASMKWIRAQIERDSETVINAWTAHLMQAVGEWPKTENERAALRAKE